MIRVIGNHVSPYVRKVILALEAKGLAYEVDPIVPFMRSEAFAAVSPLERIPVLIDGDLVVNDSSVICEYLDEAYPGAPLYPREPKARARARWLEEYADSRGGDAVLWKLFFQRAVKPRVFKQPSDEALVAQATERDLPAILAWLEPQAPATGFLCGDAPMVPDFMWAGLFRNAELAGWSLNPWPATAAWIARVQALPAFRRTVEIDTIIRTTRRPDLAAALTAAGVRVAAATVGGREPSPGVMGVA